jgi:hypothetical protein
MDATSDTFYNIHHRGRMVISLVNTKQFAVCIKMYESPASGQHSKRPTLYVILHMVLWQLEDRKERNREIGANYIIGTL